MAGKSSDTYLNPVYPQSFPDPFVLKCRDGYFAYSTGFANGPDEVFRILFSDDLVYWADRGFAMRPLSSAPPYYWAPEVCSWQGLYYLYYSSGNETLMEIRVAVSDRPDGGFVDAGRRLTSEDFAIDPHVFTDRDGSRYMFYATDFLEHTHIGTGTVVDRMVDPFTLEGRPHPVTRAKYDWQVYDPNRAEKGGVRWHTVEGPAVIERKGTYFEMFSGGNWQNTTYGVSFASSGAIHGEREWKQFSDGEKVLPLLRTLPGDVIGPGHNSIVRGPNGRELYCVYHRWTDAGRVMAIDRMDVVGSRLFVRGPTVGPQPAPYQPLLSLEKGELSSGQSFTTPMSFLLECSVRFHSTDGAPPEFGVGINGKEKIALLGDGYPPDVDPSVFHDLRIDADGRSLVATIDSWCTNLNTVLDEEVSSLAFYCINTDIEFGNLSLTPGFEDQCVGDTDAFSGSGWRLDGSGSVDSRGFEYGLKSPEGETTMRREMRFSGVNFAGNLRRDGCETFGLRLLGDNGIAAELAIGKDLRLSTRDGHVTAPFPAAWDTAELHQYELLASGGRLTVFLEMFELAEVEFDEGSLRPAIFCVNGDVTIEMVRAIAI